MSAALAIVVGALITSMPERRVALDVSMRAFIWRCFLWWLTCESIGPSRRTTIENLSPGDSECARRTTVGQPPLHRAWCVRAVGPQQALGP